MARVAASSSPSADPLEAAVTRGPLQAIVPARWDSSRLPGKVLAVVGGQPMLRRVWRAAVGAACFDAVMIATDSSRVAEAAARWGAEVRCTGEAPSGTHRAALVADANAATVVVQADQPYLDPAVLRTLAALVQEAPDGVCTLVAPFEGDPADPALVKVLARGGEAVDFSREPIPEGGPYLRHVGLYGFGPGWLQRCGLLARSERSRRADLEQLTWLDAGIPIRVAHVARAPLSVDTPGQLLAARAHTP